MAPHVRPTASELNCGARTFSASRHSACRPPARPCMPKGTRNDGGAMYIKTTRIHTDRDGRPVRSHRPVLSQRVGDRVRHRTLLSPGADCPVPKERWKAVTGPAEAPLLGRPPPLEAAPDVRAAAEDIVARLRTRGFRPEAMREEARRPATATVDLDTLEHENPRTVGCERLCPNALDGLGFAESSTARASRAARGASRRRDRRASSAGRRPQGAAAQDALPHRRPPPAPPGRHPAGAVQPRAHAARHPRHRRLPRPHQRPLPRPDPRRASPLRALKAEAR